MGKYLSREGIVTASHGYVTEEVDVPEWGGTVLVREMTVPEVTKLGMVAIQGGYPLSGAESATGPLGTKGAGDTVPVRFDLATLLPHIVDLFPEIVSWCVVDEELKPLLSLEDVLAMAGRSTGPVQQIATVALRLSNLGASKDEDEDGAEGEADDESG